MAKWKKTRICIKYVLNMLWSEQCEIIATIPPSPPPIKTLMFVPKKASRSILKHTHILQWDTMILFSFYYFMFSLKNFFKLEYSCYTVLFEFLLYNNVNQPQIHTCPLPLEPSSHTYFTFSELSFGDMDHFYNGSKISWY